MKKTISATEARVHFGELLRGVAEEGVTYFVERGGRPQAVILSNQEYERLFESRPRPSLMEAIRDVHETLGPLAEERMRFDMEGLIREEREKRAQQIEDAVSGRQRGDQSHIGQS